MGSQKITNWETPYNLKNYITKTPFHIILNGARLAIHPQSQQHHPGMQPYH